MSRGRRGAIKPVTTREDDMRLTRRSFVATTAATGLTGLRFGMRSAVAADEKVIKFGMPQDFTKIYTFVTAEYSQGARDYFSLVNGRGGVNGYKIAADVSDHANDLPRAIEAYERLKREGMVLIRSRRRSPARWCRARSRTRSTSSPRSPGGATPPTARCSPT
jgi:hypothetical protein